MDRPPYPHGVARGADDLFSSVVAVADGLDLEETLVRVVREAVELVDARYGALGLLDEAGTGLARFVTVGIDEATRARLGPPPRGDGILGELIRHPRPLRLDDLRDHPASVGVPAGHPSMGSFLGVPVRVRERVVGNLYLTDKRGGPFTVDDEEVTGALAAVAGVAVENARLHDRTRRLAAEALRRQQWVEAAGEITTRLLAGAEPGEALALVAQRAAELTGAAGALITTPPQTTGTGDTPPPVRVTVCVGLEERHPPGSRVAVECTVLDAVARSRGPHVVADLRLAPDGDGLGPGLAVPLRSGEELTGVLVVAGVDAWSGTADDDGPAVVASFADQAALVLRLAESQRARRQLDVVTDRERIAADLHDHVLQRLFALGLGLQAAHARLPESDGARRVDEAVDQIDGIIRDIRTSIFDLHTAGEGDLGARVRAVVAEMTAQAAVDPVVRVSGRVGGVPEELAVAVEAVVREAVSNTVRHAAASTVTVTVAADDQLTVDVSDDGVGIPDAVARSGLANLAARAQAAGGDAQVGRRAVGPGTRLTWWVPLDVVPDAWDERTIR
ncbi:sensor histidine kinase [Actinomycetospora soli]|uniref:sensor histidine kinase n=1 Tax=Actinomycetospora soli TaxID=2893887 RepID=UPI001E38468E|nr:GAF domain-containing protein [Actinomycetospora soli]MCD2187399.1 GAF domain-containing protein [Actinomycetospora soli]